MKNVAKIIAIILFGLIFLINYTRDDGDVKFPTVNEPIQYNLTAKQKEELKIIRFFDDWRMLFVPFAHYQISATVVDTARYYAGIDAKVSPKDIGVVWGYIQDKKVLDKMNFTLVDRFLRFEYRDFYDTKYMKTHVANMHLIPKDNKIYSKIKRIRKGDKIYMEGYLVKIEGVNTKTNTTYYRMSSLTREDGGNGACETFYVTKVLLKHKKLFDKK